jgi:hypothetical protein
MIRPRQRIDDEFGADDGDACDDGAVPWDMAA